MLPFWKKRRKNRHQFWTFISFKVWSVFYQGKSWKDFHMTSQLHMVANLILIVYSCLQTMLHFTVRSILGSNARLQEPKVQPSIPSPSAFIWNLGQDGGASWKEGKPKGFTCFSNFGHIWSFLRGNLGVNNIT